MTAFLRTPPLPFESLVVINDPLPHTAALNMAVDEVLLRNLGQVPILRCYRWANRAVSFGCFGNIQAVRSGYPGREWVRRWTGGGEVEHGEDFTYTLLVPRSLPLSTLPAKESYRWIHGTVAAALAFVGAVRIEISHEAGRRLEPLKTVHDSVLAPLLKPCFVNPVPFDLIAANGKIAGGAQRRTKNGLLHQGSIQGLVFYPPSGVPWQTSLSSALAAAMADTQTSRVLSETEIANASALASEKYSAVSWTEKY